MHAEAAADGGGGQLRADPAALRDAAARCRAVAEDLAGQAGRVTGSVPDVGSAPLHDVAAQLTARVTRLLAAVADGVDGIGDGLADAAERYAAADRSAVPAPSHQPFVGPLPPGGIR